MQVISIALQAESIFDCPKMDEKSAAHRRTVGKAAPRVICVSKLRWESAEHEIRGVPRDFLPVGCSHVFMGFVVIAIYIKQRQSYLIKLLKIKV